MAEEKAPPAHDLKQSDDDAAVVEVEEVQINASGHIQELDRNFNLLSIAGLGVTAGNTWVALAGTVVCFPPPLLLLAIPFSRPMSLLSRPISPALSAVLCLPAK